MLVKVEAKLDEVCQRILVIRIDRHPLRALVDGIDGVRADSDFAFLGAVNCVRCQAQFVAGLVVCRPAGVETLD